MYVMFVRNRTWVTAYATQQCASRTWRGCMVFLGLADGTIGLNSRCVVFRIIENKA